MSVTPASYAQFLTRGPEDNLDGTAIQDGKLRYTTDTGRLYLDVGNGVSGTRIRISDVDNSYTQAQILSLQNPLPKLYIASDTGRGFFYVEATSTWVDFGSITLTSDSTNADRVIWFSGTTDNQPKYQSNLKYNPSTETLKTPKLTVGGMNVTVTVDPEDGSHTTTFSFS